jgi:hypothetical protein
LISGGASGAVKRASMKTLLTSRCSRPANSGGSLGVRMQAITSERPDLGVSPAGVSRTARGAFQVMGSVTRGVKANSCTATTGAPPAGRQGSR